MATVAPPADRILTNPSHRDASELFQQLSLDPTKASEIPEPTKKPTINSKGATNGQIQSYDRSVTPDYYDPMMGYPGGYPPAFYYPNYEGIPSEWEDYSRSTNPEGVEIPPGVYGDGSFMYQGYGYPYGPYGPYSPGSPVPTMGPDGLLYGSQQYQYPAPYFQPLNPSSAPYSPTPAATPKGDLPIANAPAEKAPLAVETASGNINGVGKGGIQGNNGSVPTKQTYVSSQFGSNVSNGRGALPGGFPSSAYQDPRFAFAGSTSPLPWTDTPFSDGVQSKSVTSTATVPSMSNASNTQVSKNHNYHPNSNLTGYQPSQMSTMGHANGYYNGIFPNNKLYPQYGSTFRSGPGFGFNGYDSRANGRGWYSGDSKSNRSRGRFGYGNDMDGMNELNRGPRAKTLKNQKVPLPVKADDTQSNETKEDDKNKLNAEGVPDREQYNKADFPEVYSDAKFYIIKSYSEDDVHKSIKYNVWASTPNGNKKLDAAYQEAQQKPNPYPIFLFFSVNTSGQFVGVAEMVGPVNFDKNFEYWQQDKWSGCFPVKWHIVKDVSNSLLKHITLEYNENKPVTNSRDTQEVKLEQGLQVLKIFKESSSKTCILDDFDFYESRQRAIQDKKAKQQQFQKQVAEAKASDGKKEVASEESKPQKALDVAAAPLDSPSGAAAAGESKGEVKQLPSEPVKEEAGDGRK